MTAAPRRPLRIAHIITRLDLGGAQLNTLHCCARHDPRRFPTWLLAGAGGRLDHVARALPHTAVTLARWLPYNILPHRDAAATLRVARWLRKNRIDVVHTHSSKAGVVGRFAAAMARTPVVVHTVHGWSFNPTQSVARRKLFVGLERAAAEVTDALVAVSDENRRTGLAHRIGTPKQYTVIHSGIDLDTYRPDARRRSELRAALGYTDEQIVVGTVAALKPQKAPLDFVRAAAKVHQERPDVRFFIAGGGPLRDDVMQLAKTLGVHDALSLLGWRDDAPALYNAMDIFLLTSVFEGLPQAVLQAMASKTPVVATAVNGTPEVIVDGETGRLVPAHSPARQAAATLELIADPALALDLAQRAHASLGERFDRNHMVETLETLYADLFSDVSSARGDLSETASNTD